MNSKGHLIISLVKSTMRILGAVGVLFFKSPVQLLVFAIFAAEILGIFEELVDER